MTGIGWVIAAFATGWVLGAYSERVFSFAKLKKEIMALTDKIDGAKTP